MKSLNSSSNLWTNMSAKEVENSNYSSSCCFNVRVSTNKDGVAPSPKPQPKAKPE